MRWTGALLALVLAGALAAVLGWRELADGGERPGPRCIAHAVEAAEQFAAVMGDRRPVARVDVERSCVERP